MDKKPYSDISFYLLPLGVILLQLSYKVVTDGMFLDGLIYAAIAHNMANGFGTFWTPAFTNFAFAPVFYEHPPLAFWLQSLFFRIFGDDLYVERLYSLTTMALTFALIHAIWAQVSKRPNLSFLPITMWTLVQGVAWTYANNLLENTMTVFILFSIWLYLISRSTIRVPFLILSGISLSLAFLTKGPTSLFPLALPGIYWLLEKDRFVRFFSDQSLLIVATAIPLALLWTLPDASSEFLTTYFRNQVQGSIESVVTVEHRTYILTKYIELLLVPVIYGGILIVIAKKLSGKWCVDFSAPLPFILASLSGVLPIMVSLKQRAFYINAVFPLTSIAVALLVLPALLVLLDSPKARPRFEGFSKWLGAVTLIAAIAVAAISWGKPGRDHELIPALHEAFSIIPNESTVGLDKSFNPRFSIHAYFMRYADIHLDPGNDHHRFYIGKSAPTPEFREVLVLPPDMLLFDKGS